MQRIIPVTLLVALLSFQLAAQQLPLYTQYVFNPYLINPSMVAFNNRAEVNALYRKQWTQIQDGPKTLQFDIQLPLNSKMGLGLNIYNDQSVLLSGTSVLLTYGYKIQLATDHQLGFGISAGIFSNRINLNGVSSTDANDPALLSASLNNTAMNGQFGAHYKFKDFTLGFSMVNLIERKTFTPEEFQTVKFGALKNQIYFASYRFTLVHDTWYFQPNIAYRQTQDNLNYYEASAFVSYAHVIDVGGGYRQNFGPSAMVRLSWKQLSVGVAYDFPANKAQVSTGGTQEIQLKWRFGKDVAPIAKKNTTVPAEEEILPPIQNEKEAEKLPDNQEEKKTEVSEQPKVVADIPKEPTINEPAIVEKKTDVVVEKKTEPAVEKVTPPEVAKPSKPETYYFVVGTFQSKANAQNFYNELAKKGIAAEIRESKPGKVPHYFYVHLPKHKSEEISVDKLLELQKATGLQGAWFTKFD